MRPISAFAVEADYIDLGSQNTNVPSGPVGTTQIHYKTFAGYAVGYLPIPLPWVDVFGKAGIDHWHVSGFGGCTGGACSIGPFSSDNGTQFAWGVGGQVHVGNFGGRLEYEKFVIRNTGGANLVSFSVFLNLL